MVVEAVMAFVVAEAALEEKGTKTTRIRPALKTVSRAATIEVRHVLMGPRSLHSPWHNRNNGRNDYVVLIGRKRRRRIISHAVTLPVLIFNLDNRTLWGLMRNSGRVDCWGRSGEGKIGPFYTEEEIAESDQLYCCRYYILVIMWLILWLFVKVLCTI